MNLTYVYFQIFKNEKSFGLSSFVKQNISLVYNKPIIIVLAVILETRNIFSPDLNSSGVGAYVKNIKNRYNVIIYLFTYYM